MQGIYKTSKKNNIMKSKFLKGMLSAVFMLSVATSFAQPGNPEGEVDEPTPANIDTTLVVLMAGAVALGSYMLIKNRKQANA